MPAPLSPRSKAASPPALADALREIAAIVATYRGLWLTLVGLALAMLPLSSRIGPLEIGLSIGLALVLATLVVIDLDQFRLPDVLTLPLIAAGVLLVPLLDLTDGFAHGTGALVAFGLFYGVAEAYRYLRGHAGLGLGDAKLFAAAGAWCTGAGLLLVLAIASGVALLALGVLALRGTAVSGTTRIAFGPFLALGFWLVWTFGPLA